MASPGDLSFGLLEKYKLDLESDLDSEFDPNSDDESAEGMKPTVQKEDQQEAVTTFEQAFRKQLQQQRYQDKGEWEPAKGMDQGSQERGLELDLGDWDDYGSEEEQVEKKGDETVQYSARYTDDANEWEFLDVTLPPSLFEFYANKLIQKARSWSKNWRTEKLIKLRLEKKHLEPKVEEEPEFSDSKRHKKDESILATATDEEKCVIGSPPLTEIWENQLMTEEEWGPSGLNLNLEEDWKHYVIFQPNLEVLLFRRPKQVSSSNSEAGCKIKTQKEEEFSEAEQNENEGQVSEKDVADPDNLKKLVLAAWASPSTPCTQVGSDLSQSYGFTSDGSCTDGSQGFSQTRKQGESDEEEFSPKREILPEVELVPESELLSESDEADCEKETQLVIRKGQQKGKSDQKGTPLDFKLDVDFHSDEEQKQQSAKGFSDENGTPLDFQVDLDFQNDEKQKMRPENSLEQNMLMDFAFNLQ